MYRNLKLLVYLILLLNMVDWKLIFIKLHIEIPELKKREEKSVHKIQTNSSRLFPHILLYEDVMDPKKGMQHHKGRRSRGNAEVSSWQQILEGGDLDALLLSKWRGTGENFI